MTKSTGKATTKKGKGHPKKEENKDPPKKVSTPAISKKRPIKLIRLLLVKKVSTNFSKFLQKMEKC